MEFIVAMKKITLNMKNETYKKHLLVFSAILISLLFNSCNQKNTTDLLNGAGVEMEEMIKSLDGAWATAIIEKDVSQLDLLLADNLIYGHASGVLDTKSSYIEKVASGTQIYKSLEQKNVLVRSLGSDAAVSHSWMHVTGTNQNGSFDDKVMMLHVWTKRDNSWKLVGHQTAKVDKIPY
jgi:ketosteroid isomerase-like protein